MSARKSPYSKRSLIEDPAEVFTCPRLILTRKGIIGADVFDFTGVKGHRVKERVGGIKQVKSFDLSLALLRLFRFARFGILIRIGESEQGQV